MSGYALDWLDLLVRWFHLTAGIAWIGASFYFVWLDNHLVAPPPAESQRGVAGELWAVHGGGFYHNQKYMTGPRDEPLTPHLHWFYWEAYSTWLSGFALLAIVYWAGAASFLIDKSVLDISVPVAIALSMASLVVGWLVYDALCRIFEKQPAALWTAIGIFLLAADYALFHTFGARAAYIHVGAMIGTIMVANVLFVIIPGQRKVVRQLRAGELPDARPGFLGKQRSVQNTYFTLPVLFIMISNHYPMTYGGTYGWLVLAFIAVAGVLVRRFFILTHKQRYVIGLPVAAALAIVAVAVVFAPRQAVVATGATGAAASRVQFARIAPIVAERCAVCHAAHPTQPGFAVAPMGVLLDTPESIAANAERIREQAVASNAMPLGNITKITPAERALLGRWIEEGASIAVSPHGSP
jgi:uncharacterized membrane protein